MPTPVPYAITRQDDGLLIEWEQEGHRRSTPPGRSGWPAAAPPVSRR